MLWLFSNWFPICSCRCRYRYDAIISCVNISVGHTFCSQRDCAVSRGSRFCCFGFVRPSRRSMDRVDTGWLRSTSTNDSYWIPLKGRSFYFPPHRHKFRSLFELYWRHVAARLDAIADITLTAQLIAVLLFWIQFGEQPIDVFRVGFMAGWWWWWWRCTTTSRCFAFYIYVEARQKFMRNKRGNSK